MSSLEQLLLKARKIKAETTDRANTALRIGGWMEEVLLYLDEVLEGKLPTQSSELITKSKELVSAINEIASMSNLSSERYNNVIAKLALLNSLHPIAYSGDYKDLKNRPCYENRVVLEMPAYEDNGVYMPLMSWCAYEDVELGHEYITKGVYHYLLAFNNGNLTRLGQNANYSFLLQATGVSSMPHARQYFYNGSVGVTVPFTYVRYYDNIEPSKSRVFLCLMSNTLPKISSKSSIAIIPLSLNMPDFRWENPCEILDTTNKQYSVYSGSSYFSLAFPDAQLTSRVNSGNSNGIEQLLYVPTGANKTLNLNTDETIEIEASDDNNTTTVDWGFSVKKVPKQLSINEKTFDGSEELEIEVADTPLTTQEILSILT